MTQEYPTRVGGLEDKPIAWVLLDEGPDVPQPIGVFASHAAAKGEAERLRLNWWSAIGVEDFRRPGE